MAGRAGGGCLIGGFVGLAGGMNCCCCCSALFSSSSSLLDYLIKIMNNACIIEETTLGEYEF